jgi:hypothetical protein
MLKRYVLLPCPPNSMVCDSGSFRVPRPQINSQQTPCSLLKVVNIHAASEKFAELIPLLESNADVYALKEKLEDEYLEIPGDSVKRVFAGQYLACY